MENLSFSALQQLQFIHDFPCACRFADSSDSPCWAIWKELTNKGYIIESQGYVECDGELIENGMGYDITPLGNAYLLEFSQRQESHDITSIYLNRKELSILRKMKKSKDPFIKVAPEYLAPLVMAGVADFEYRHDNVEFGPVPAFCRLTNTGKRYLEYRRDNSIKAWIPIVISVVALISSVILPLVLT